MLSLSRHNLAFSAGYDCRSVRVAAAHFMNVFKLICHGGYSVLSPYTGIDLTDTIASIAARLELIFTGLIGSLTD